MERIRIAKIVNTHGIKGEVKVIMFDDFEANCFTCGKKVSFTNGKENIDMTPLRCRVHKETPLVIFKEIQNMSDAEKYKGYLIEMELEDLPDKEDGTFYNFELIGLNVVDQNKREIGIVKAVENTTTTNAVLRIEREVGADVLVPFVDAFILDIDMDEEIMTINVIEGLL